MLANRRWMKLSYDLSEQSPLPPGIPALSRKVRSSVSSGGVSNVVDLFICNHAGSHMDAPLHFVEGGAPIDQIAPEVFIGPCVVVDLRAV